MKKRIKAVVQPHADDSKEKEFERRVNICNIVLGIVGAVFSIFAGFLLVGSMETIKLGVVFVSLYLLFAVVICFLLLHQKSTEPRHNKHSKKRTITIVISFCFAMVFVPRFIYNANTTHEQMPSLPQTGTPTESINSTVTESPETPNRTFDAGSYHYVLIHDGGMVGALGDKGSERCNVSNWTDITDVSAYSHTVGLKSDGTVEVTGPNKYNQCDITDWTDIIDIDAGGKNTIGLKSDGTVIVAGDNSNHQCDASGWKNIKQVEMGEQTAYGLTESGTVLYQGGNQSQLGEVSTWSKITYISAGQNHIVALKEDGTVVADGSNAYGQCDIDNWTDIIAVSAGHTHTLGLKSDGTVVSTYRPNEKMCQVSSWKNVIAIGAGMHFSVGITEDGETLIAGFLEGQ